MLPKAYDPSGTEDRIYKMWEESGAFKADCTSDKESFTVSMPPPNATGQLHLGHAVMLALEDIFIRFARMQGKEALWVPGTDHAAIATENVVIRNLKKDGMKNPREELGREKLIEEIEKYISGSQNTIRSQVRKMGSSCDWSREAYTMDASLNRCVNEVFVKMHNDGLIYRGNRIVNWDPNLQTNVSDDEVAHVTRKDPFYTFRYGPFEIGTVRPETKFGDKYVVMHPDDERYKEYKHGDTFECEWINGKITATVIKDPIVDMEFGSGCMTITPYHDHTDFELMERHNLSAEQIIDFDGTLLPVAGEFSGMNIEEAREKVVARLEKKGLVVKVDENYEHAVATNSRGGGKVEPQIRLQWFIDVNKEAVDWKNKKMSLKQVMQDVIHSGDIKIIPERFEKTYFHWIDNLRDWCISRQIWWGHRVPVYYCMDCQQPLAVHVNSAADPDLNVAVQQGRVLNPDIGKHVSVTHLDVCPDCGSSVKQDSDTLDTWFSSGLWTWSTLVDKEAAKDFSINLKTILERSPDFKKFHPTQVMETAYDILFFWVARMIMMTMYATGQIPFETVYLHGLIRAKDGRKMSKSHPETMIDPLDMISKYGTDALRLSMIVGQSPGNDSKLYEEKIAGYRNFVNKLWNASRFVLMQCEEEGVDAHDIPDDSISTVGETSYDASLRSMLQELIKNVTDGLSEKKLSEVGQQLYGFIWGEYCDWYLELSKGKCRIENLVFSLRIILKLLHPFCPFVTEELWIRFKPNGSGMLIKEEWPKLIYDVAQSNETKENSSCERTQLINDNMDRNVYEEIKEIIASIRQVRSDYSIKNNVILPMVYICYCANSKEISSESDNIKRLAKVKDIKIVLGAPSRSDSNISIIRIISCAEVHVPFKGLIDVDKERDRLTKERVQLEGFLKSVQGKLGNKQFVANAPEEVITKEWQKEEDAKGKLKKIEEKLGQLG